MDMVAMMGHSFGGGTTLQSLSEDGRLKWVELAVMATSHTPFPSFLKGVVLDWTHGWFQSIGT